ncbi:MAG: hypothetical protein E6G67_05705 [Actinobacteria bacterium]|nr:MAG: hypothetical protein E6G67_05705 [Actinomycetota bacterium]
MAPQRAAWPLHASREAGSPRPGSGRPRRLPSPRRAPRPGRRSGRSAARAAISAPARGGRLPAGATARSAGRAP